MWRKNSPLLMLAAAGLGLGVWLGLLFTIETPFGSLRPLDVFALIWSVAWLRPGVTLIKRNISLFLISGGLLSWLILLTALQGENLFLGLAYLGRWALYLFTAWSLSTWLAGQTGKMQTRIDLWAIFWLGIGLFQYVFWPDTRILYYLGWDDHLFRAFGTLFDPLFFGLGASLLAWRGYRRLSFSPTPARILLSLGFIAVALSYSRLAYLSILIWLVLESFPLARIRHTVSLGLLFLVLLVFIPKDGGGEGQKLLRTASLEARLEAGKADIGQVRSWRETLIGQGWYTRQTSESLIPNHATLADSFWLQMWLSGGAVALALLVVLGWKKRGFWPLLTWHAITNCFALVSLSPFLLLFSALVLGGKKDKNL